MKNKQQVITIPSLSVMYSESKNNPLWLVAYLLEGDDESKLYMALTTAKNKEEAENIPVENGVVVYAERLHTLFSRAQFMTEVDSRLKLS